MGRLLLLLGLLVASPAWAAADDPLASVMWDVVRKHELAPGPVRFDPRVVVQTPRVVENTMAVPVLVDASAIEGVEEVVVLVDHNPIPKVLSFRPTAAAPRLELRLKIQEASPIRAAARTRDGTWHVGGLRVDAAGGGCTVPTAGSAQAGWQDRLAQVSGRAWAKPGGGERIRLQVQHPMDTGLVAGIPAFYLETLEVRGAKGEVLARLETFEPVAENPVFTIDLNRAAGPYRVTGRDNNGTEIDAVIPRGRR